MLNRLQPYQKDIVNRAVCQKKHRLERERDEAREELAALKEMIAKSGLIEVEATTCIADKCGKPTIVKDGTMLVHKDEKLRIQQRTVDLQKHAATARKLAAERALADRLVKVVEHSAKIIGPPDCVHDSRWETGNELDDLWNRTQSALSAWKEARSE